MLLALTWGHCTPADTPTSSCITAISNEHELDDVACASYVSRQGGADTLASNNNVVRGGAAALLHQGCPVPVRDCQVVVATGERVIVIFICVIIIFITRFFNVKCSEL